MPIGYVKKASRVTPLILATVLFLFLVPSLAWSATLTWTGDGGSSSFNNAGNWSPAQIPTLADDCIINSTNTNQPGITQNSQCGSLTLGTGGTVMTLSFATTRNLTIAGDVIIGLNGRITNSGGSASGTFEIGGDWSDDLATANIDTSGSLLLTYLFPGTNKTITTNNETFFNVVTDGDISLNSDMTVENRFRISNGIFTHGPNTLTLNGNFFNINNGTYNHDCSSTVVINGRITMVNNDRYPNTIVNSSGRLEGPNTGFIDCDLTIQAGAELLLASNFFIGGDWINNGGVITMDTDAVYMTGAGAEISGTTPTTFYDLIIGDTAGDSTTAVQNITIDNDLTVFSGADFTLQGGSDITLNTGSAVIDGTVSLSGTSTWYQAGAAGAGITVNPGGSISAQGTDAANRVTFTRSDADYYDFVIQGGIDFDNVNVYYTGSADANSGFAINGAGVVNFDTVALDNTQDINGAVMMYWNSPQSIVSQDCSFDSATYASGNGDVNVEATQGQIVFVNFGGNYSGEALDNDNGGLALWDPAVTSAVAEIDPNAVIALSTGNAFTYDILPTMQPWDTGVDQIVITAPAGYSNLNVTGVSVGGANPTANCPVPGVNEYCATVTGQAMTVLLGSTVTTSLTNIQISFDADAPAAVGADDFTSTVDDTSTSTPPQATTPGNADGDAGDADSQTVTVGSGSTINWIGGVSSDFGDPNNWGPAIVPDATRTCVIDSYTNFQPTLLTNEICGEMFLGTGATVMTLTFTGANDLTITGDVSIGSNGRIAESGVTSAIFSVGGSWSDDIATTNFVGTIPLQYNFTGTNKTISTNESFYDLLINGTISLVSDIDIGNSLSIPNGKTLNHGAFTISHYGNIFSVNGTYNHTCSSIVEFSGTITLVTNKHYPNVILNSGGNLTGSNPAYIDCDLTLQAGSTFNYGTLLFLGGDWINNGATLNLGSSDVTMTGAGAEIRGTASSAFQNLIIGDEAGDSTTAFNDITIANDLDVPAGSTFALQSGRDIDVTGIALIGGEVYLSGNSTWLQSGINNGIQVNSGGLLSAQGTDDANRVTFDWNGTSNYDLIIDGGIDFNYVNVFNSDSARFNLQGFRINTPIGETVSLNNLAVNFTLDVPSSVMLIWNSPQTVTCNRCSFDSPTFSPANDVNVEALQGEIIFFGYGGNFAGEALDDDNGGIATWITITTTIGDGTSPSNKIVAVNSTNNAVNAFTLSTDNGTETLTDLTVTFTGTDVNDVSASGVKIYEDNGSIANEWDSSDTPVTNGTASFSGATANFTGLNISINTTPTQYLITFDIVSTATTGNTLLGAVTAATVTDSLINNDTNDATLTVGGCQVVITADSGAGSLRECINYANLNPGTTISFNIPDTDPGYQTSGGDNWWRISPGLALPSITAANTVIDGTTQTTNQGDTNSRGPEIEIDGTGTGAGVDGLVINIPGGSATIRYLVVDNFNGNGILLQAGSTLIAGNYIGLEPDGDTLAGNNTSNTLLQGGIRIESAGNTIGGTTVADRNVISGNASAGIVINGAGATGNQVLGNYIGLDAGGALDRGNTGDGEGIEIELADGNTIGGTSADARNVISGNASDGIEIDGSDLNIIQGNYIGTDYTGSIAIPNDRDGIDINANGANGSTGNIIGGTAVGAGNLISGNTLNGIELRDELVAGSTTDNSILGNLIYGNGQLGIDLEPVGVTANNGTTDALPNSGMDYPVFTATALTGSNLHVEGYVGTSALKIAGTHIIEVFKALDDGGSSGEVELGDGRNVGHGEGQSYIDRCFSAADGTFACDLTVPGTVTLAAGDFVTATATDAINNTSEFSANELITLSIVKQAWLPGGAAPLASPVDVPTGMTVVFLIYVKNTTGGQVTDIRITDNLDETGFQYVAGSLFRDDGSLADTATDLDIFNATAPGTGTNLSDVVDGDIGSAQDTGGSADVDLITIGQVPAQTNGNLDINGNSTFAIRFQVTVK